MQGQALVEHATRSLYNPIFVLACVRISSSDGVVLTVDPGSIPADGQSELCVLHSVTFPVSVKYELFPMTVLPGGEHDSLPTEDAPC